MSMWIRRKSRGKGVKQDFTQFYPSSRLDMWVIITVDLTESPILLNLLSCLISVLHTFKSREKENTDITQSK